MTRFGLLTRSARRRVFVGVVGVSLAAMGLSGAGIANHAPHARQLVAAGSARACPMGFVPDAALIRAAGGTPACAVDESPEGFSDLAPMAAEWVAREAAPFNFVTDGAYAEGVQQAAAIARVGGRWSAAGSSPDCDGHTDVTSACPLTDNTSTAEANGAYTISQLGHRQLSGRINAFTGDPKSPDRVWAAPAVGGVFETDDGGLHWHSIADNLPTQTMSGLAYSVPMHRLFAGTGDYSFGGDAFQGLGVFYTSNDGRTWTRGLGLPRSVIVFRLQVAGGDPSGKTVYAATSLGLFRSIDGGVHWVNLKLPTSPPGYTVPDPRHHGRQVSCAGNTTAPLCFFASIVTDVVVKHSSSKNAPAGAVMAVVGWRAGAKNDKNPNGTDNTTCRLSGKPTVCEQAPRNGLYISMTGKPGSFKFEHHDGSSAGTDFAPDSVVGRTSLGIADGQGQNNDAVFALVQDAQKFNGCTDDVFDDNKAQACQATIRAEGEATILDGAYATYDFGKTWTKIMNWTQLNKGSGSLLLEPGYSPGVQSWYNNWIKPDPTANTSGGDPTRVIFGLEEIWENNVTVPGVLTTPWVAYNTPGAAAPWIDIGRYWNSCGGVVTTGGVPCDTTGNPSTSNAPTTHPDQHAFYFAPDQSGGVTLYVGNDGGAYKQHVAKGADYSKDGWGEGIDRGLYTLQPYDAEISRDGTIVAGLQDNGEMKIAPGGKEQHTIFGGDGFFTAIDPANSKDILEEYTYGATSMSLNGGGDWYAISPDCGGNSSESQFATPLEQDPTVRGHIVVGCTMISEAGDGASGDPKTGIWTNPCAAPPGGDPFQCQTVNVPWVTDFDLGLATAPGKPVDRNTTCNVTTCVFNVPSAVGVRGPNIYVGYCGYCDIVTGGVPFRSGIATNVGGKKPPKPGTSNGWHIAHAYCSNCHTANGKLPQRFITSIHSDPGNPRTVYVTMGGYGRRWIPPGALGDSTKNVGVGHVFVSHDAGEHFRDISRNLPGLPANFALVHGKQLVVATDAGVYITAKSGNAKWKALGSRLPNAPVFTLRLQPGHPNRMIAATYGRGIWQ